VPQETVTVEAGPQGVKGSVTGSQVLPVLLAGLIGAWAWYLFYNHEARADDKTKAQVIATEKLAAAIDKQSKAIEQQERTQRAMIYVLALPQKEREKLNLVRPEILYEMQRYGR
jgi:hypothetical protein